MVTRSQYKSKSIALSVLIKRDKPTDKDIDTINGLIKDVTDYEEKQGRVKPLTGIALELSKYKLNKWARLIKTREEYTCYMCNDQDETYVLSDNIEAHHIYPKGDPRYINRAYDLSNGITLCHECHRDIVHDSWVNWRKFTSMFRQYMRRKKVFQFNNEKQEIL